MCAFIKKVNKTLRILRKWGVLLLCPGNVDTEKERGERGNPREKMGV
jgi:hypothetical protein